MPQYWQPSYEQFATVYKAIYSCILNMKIMEQAIFGSQLLALILNDNACIQYGPRREKTCHQGF